MPEQHLLADESLPGQTARATHQQKYVSRLVCASATTLLLRRWGVEGGGGALPLTMQCGGVWFGDCVDSVWMRTMACPHGFASSCWTPWSSGIVHGCPVSRRMSTRSRWRTLLRLVSTTHGTYNEQRRSVARDDVTGAVDLWHHTRAGGGECFDSTGPPEDQ